MTVTLLWRGAFTNEEVNALHAEAFETRLYDESEWDWVELTPAGQGRLDQALFVLGGQ